VQAKVLVPFYGKDWLVVGEGTAEDVPEGSPRYFSLSVHRLVDVVEGSRIGLKCKTPRTAEGQHIGKALPASDVQELEHSCSLTPLLELIEEQVAIGGDTDRDYGRVLTRSTLSRIDEQLVNAFQTLAEINARLFLPRKTLSEEIPLLSLENRVVGLNVKQCTDAVADATAARNRV